MQLRSYQIISKRGIYNAWNNGNKNVLLVQPARTGKTVVFSDIINEHRGASCVIVHRQELVGQASLALARNKIKHRIIGPTKVIRMIVNIHMLKIGTSYYDPSAQCAVAGVDTLIRRYDELSHWFNSVTLWVLDEAHHLLKNNKWGKAVKMLPNAKGLGVTATALRADGFGLGRSTDGLIDIMVESIEMREAINQKFLTDYRIFAPPSDLDLTAVTVSKTTGDYNPNKLKIAIRKSHVIGDVVKHYLKIAPGKLGITFADNVETANDIAEQFNNQGVSAVVVTAKTSDSDRVNISRRLENREIMQLVNVDIFGEGYDLPSIEVVSMARPTESFGLYYQQFMRALTIMEGKDQAIIIDHAGNVKRHGLPDAPRKWSLERRDKRGKNKISDVIPIKICIECTSAYERIHKFCPYCGHRPIPSSRSGPEFVDGDLTELDASTLAAMRGEVQHIDRNPEDYRQELIDKDIPKLWQLANVKRFIECQTAQKALRESIAWWAGYQRSYKRSDSESYRRFYFMFGMDVMTAQTLKTKDAIKLADKINQHLGELAK
jgi:superfamily II DNA or RNA helicase